MASAIRCTSFCHVPESRRTSAEGACLESGGMVSPLPVVVLRQCARASGCRDENLAELGQWVTGLKSVAVVCG